MKSLQHALASGDTQSLRQKAGNLAAKAAEGGKMAIRAAVNKALHGELDENFKQAHERLVSVHVTWNTLSAALKHQGERARKTAKTLRETGEPLQDLTSFLDPESRRSVRTSMAQDVAVAAKWEEYVQHLELDLLGPAKAECTAIFREGEYCWSQYVATVNELAARQSKERLMRGDSESTAALAEKKEALESTKVPQLHALVQHASAAMAFLVEQHRQLLMALYRVRERATSPPPTSPPPHGPHHGPPHGPPHGPHHGPHHLPCPHSRSESPRPLFAPPLPPPPSPAPSSFLAPGDSPHTGRAGGVGRGFRRHGGGD
jgi:hypothetical protein